MDERERQEQLARIDAWLTKLHAEHPLLFDLLALAGALVVFGLGMLLKSLLESIGG